MKIMTVEAIPCLYCPITNNIKVAAVQTSEVEATLNEDPENLIVINLR
jgi:hypothetical protein